MLLSNEKIGDLATEMVKGGKSVNWLARAIEAELLTEQAKEKPVAKVCFDQPNCIGWNPEIAVNDFDEGTPLYLHPAPPEGMVMVPREPTSAMLDAVLDGVEWAGDNESLMAEAYRKMIAAAGK